MANKKVFTDESLAALVDETKAYVDSAVSEKADSSHNHDDIYETKGTAETKANAVQINLDTHIEDDSKHITSDEKTKLSGIETGAQKNTITGVKGNSETNYRTGNVNITKANIGLGNVDNTSDANKPVSTAQQTAIDDSLASAKSYTDTKTSGLASTSSVDTKISTHNTSTSAHNDIRDLINGLTTRLNTLADSDDTTLDQMSEVVAYIKSNKELIDAITTSKVNVDDIVNNLTTNVTNKPLSAAQGVAIKSLIDELQVVVDGKADKVHTHVIDDVTNLQTELDAINSELDGSIKDLSVSGQVITYTKNDGTTGTITTQDTDTTYTPAKLGFAYFTASSISSSGVIVASTTSSGFSLKSGCMFAVKFSTGSNVASGAKLQVSGSSYPIYHKGSAIKSGVIKNNDTATFIFHSSRFYLISLDRDDNTTYSTGTSSTSGLTRLYSETGTNTNGTMTQAAISSTLESYETKEDAKIKYDELKEIKSNWSQLDETAPDFIKNKPFGEVIAGGDTLTWEVTTDFIDSHDGFDMTECLISESTPTYEELAKGGTIVTWSKGGTVGSDLTKEIVNFTEEDFLVDGDLIMIDIYIIVVNNENGYTDDFLSFPKAGVYHMCHSVGEGTDETLYTYATSLTINGYTGFQSKTEKKLDAKWLEPFEVIEAGGDTLTWDGDTTGRTVIENDNLGFVVYLSEATPSINDFELGASVLVVVDGTEEAMELSAEMITQMEEHFINVAGCFLVCSMDNCTSTTLDLTLPKKGLYALMGDSMYCSSLKINGYTGFQTTTKQIKEEYLPEMELISIDDIDAICGSSVE